jgi:hypothetical protein
VTTAVSLHGPRRRRALGAAAAVAGTVGLMGAGGCGIQSSGMRVVGSAPTLQAANDVSGSGSAGGGNQYELYFFRNGRLTPVVRYTDQTVTEDVVLAALIKGPNSTDQSDGYDSVVPTSLSVVSTTADNQQWNYQYSLPLSIAEKAEIVCTVQADLGAPSVGTWTKGGQIWNNCYDFSEDYGAPAIVPSADSDTTSTGIDGN